MQIPKAEKRQSSQAAFCAFGPVSIKAVRKHVDKIDPRREREREWRNLSQIITAFRYYYFTISRPFRVCIHRFSELPGFFNQRPGVNHVTQLPFLLTSKQR